MSDNDKKVDHVRSLLVNLAAQAEIAGGNCLEVSGVLVEGWGFCIKVYKTEE
jgi:hypothetical protein